MAVYEGFDFFEVTERGANSAEMAFQHGVTDFVGEFKSDDMMRRFAKYNRGYGYSMIRNFRLIPATWKDRTMTTAEMNKLERDYVRNGFQAEDARAFLKTITQLRDYKMRMQVIPFKDRVQSDVINTDDLMLEMQTNDRRAALASHVGSAEFVRGIINEETLKHNNSFFQALDDTVKHGIWFKKTRPDGGVNFSADENNKDENIPLPIYCQYTTKDTDGALSVEDLLLIQAQRKENMTGLISPDGGRMLPMVLIMSPWTAAQFMIKNSDRENILQKAMFGEQPIGTVPPAYGFTFYQHELCPDNCIYGVVPGLTVEVFDWGTTTLDITDPLIKTDHYIQRTNNYGVKVTQPLSFMYITLNGVTDKYRTITVKNADGSTTETDRISAITATSEDDAQKFIKPIRKIDSDTDDTGDTGGDTNP